MNRTENGHAKLPPDAQAVQAECEADAPTKRGNKTRLRTLDQLDGRTVAARRASSLVNGLESDLGGAEHLSVGQRELVKRAALLGAFIEDCEVRWLKCEAVEITEYLSAINVQRRVLATIGLERRAKDLTPSVEEYARRVNGEAAL